MGIGLLEKVVGYLKDFLEFLSSEKAEKGFEQIAEAAAIIVKVIALFNDEPSNARKREYARAALKFMKYAPMEELRRIVEIKECGALDGLEPYEMDAVLGATIAAHVSEKATARRKTAGKSR